MICNTLGEKSKILKFLSILRTQKSVYWLWGSNFGWSASHFMNVASGGATAVVGLGSRLATTEPTHFGHLLAVGTMALQYFIPAVYLAIRTPPIGMVLGLCLCVFLTYGVGLALWAFRFPKSEVFGYHEWFHVSVIAGHLASMACDLRYMLAPFSAMT